MEKEENAKKKQKVDKEVKIGQLRVGRCTWKGSKRLDPSFKDFTPIVVLTKVSKKEYADLGPYEIKDEKGRIHENIWQFSKVYESVPHSKQTVSRFSKKVIWEYPEATFIKDGKLTDEYFNWRKKGMENKVAVRYPVGKKHRKECLYSLEEGNMDVKLDYVASRKKIYFPLFSKLVKNQSRFYEIQDRLKKGENLLIIEVDGPHQESLDYYKENYQVDDDFIENSTMLVNEKNISIMLNDKKHAFGHGYCLAVSLLEKDEWITK